MNLPIYFVVAVVRKHSDRNTKPNQTNSIKWYLYSLLSLLSVQLINYQLDNIGDGTENLHFPFSHKKRIIYYIPE